MSIQSWSLRFGVTAVLLIVLFGARVGGAASEPIYSGTYENEAYGFSFEWDEAIWTIDTFTSDGADGANLGTASSFGMIWGIAFEGDSNTCFDDMLASLASDASGEFKVAPEAFDRPEPGGGLQGELVLARYTDDTGYFETLFYVACRPLAEGAAVLNVMLAVSADHYELEFGHWQALLGSVEIFGDDSALAVEFDLGIAADDAVDARETGMDGNAYDD